MAAVETTQRETIHQIHPEFAQDAVGGWAKDHVIVDDGALCVSPIPGVEVADLGVLNQDFDAHTVVAYDPKQYKNIRTIKRNEDLGSSIVLEPEPYTEFVIVADKVNRFSR